MPPANDPVATIFAVQKQAPSQRLQDGLILFSGETETILSPTLRMATQVGQKKQSHNELERGEHGKH